jgi:hypothetical protein
VYAIHDYAWPGFIDGGPYPGYTRGEYFDKSRLEEIFVNRCEYMLTSHVPIWVGEFGPVYTGDKRLDQMRSMLLQDQLDIYEKYQASWSLWTYKDIGLQGIVMTDPDSSWMKKVKPILQLKEDLGADAWGGLIKKVQEVINPLESLFGQHFPTYQPFPFDSHWQISRLVRHILLSEPILEQAKFILGDLEQDDIEALMASFRFEACLPRTDVCEMLKQNLLS